MTLETYREATLETARRGADAARADTEARATARVTAARAEAERLLAAARREGIAAADRAGGRLRSRARRDAQQRVLAARRQAYEGLRAAVLAALTEGGHGTALVAAARTEAHAQLGDAAGFTPADTAPGGFVATEGRRSVDYRLPALVERGIAALGDRVAELWT